jgi:hypothetical protein
MAAPVIRISAPGVARVVSLGGAVRVTVPGATQPWPGPRHTTITATGDRRVLDEGGRRMAQIVVARVGELTDAALTLEESRAVLGDLSGAIVGWSAQRADSTVTIAGDATGSTEGRVTLHLDIAADVAPGVYRLWVHVDGVTWPTERAANALTLRIEEDR